MAPVDSVHREGGSEIDERGPLPPPATTAYSSMKTADATPAVALTAIIGLPSRTTMIEPTWKASTRGEADGVAVADRLRVLVTVGIGVIVGVGVSDCEPVVEAEGEDDAVVDAEAPSVNDMVDNAVTDAEDEVVDVRDPVPLGVPVAVSVREGVPLGVLVAVPVREGVPLPVAWVVAVGVPVPPGVGGACGTLITLMNWLDAAAVASSVHPVPTTAELSLLVSYRYSALAEVADVVAYRV